MTTALAIRRSIASALKDEVGDLLEVQEHGGRFGPEEIARFSVRAPCAVVCSLGVSSVWVEGDEPVAGFDWGVFLMTKDKPGLRRDESILLLVGKVLKTVNPNQRWGLDGVHMMTGLKGQNLYNGKATDDKGLSLWALSWTQALDIDLIDVDSLSPFKDYESTMKVSDNTDTPTGDDKVTLEGYTAGA